MAGGRLTLAQRQNLGPVQILLGTCRETNDDLSAPSVRKGTNGYQRCIPQKHSTLLERGETGVVSADGRHRHSHRAERNALLEARHLPAIVVALQKPPGLVSKRFASGANGRRGRLTKSAHLDGRAARRETSVGDNATTDECSTHFS